MSVILIFALILLSQYNSDSKFRDIHLYLYRLEFIKMLQ